MQVKVDASSTSHSQNLAPSPGVDTSEWVTIHNINLTKQEQTIIDNGSWLNDKIINASQMLLANEFPFIEGFIDVVVLRHMSLNAPAHGDAIQCHHIGNR